MVYRVSDIFLSDAFFSAVFRALSFTPASSSTFVLVFGGFFFSVGKLKSINGQCFSFS
jgi:hypothetical protein